jgi:hypothetical protein
MPTPHDLFLSMIAAAKVIAPMMAKTIRSMKGMRYK